MLDFLAAKKSVCLRPHHVGCQIRPNRRTEDTVDPRSDKELGLLEILEGGGSCLYAPIWIKSFYGGKELNEFDKIERSMRTVSQLDEACGSIVLASP